jgi:growth factor-regulated tyrosine kinase substrate
MKPNEDKGPHELSNDETNQEMFLFVDELKKYLDIFSTRMKSNSVRGRTITNDTAVQSLFLQLQQMQPKLQAFTKFQEDARGILFS